jgi:amino acid adenylation domain-containing protein
MNNLSTILQSKRNNTTGIYFVNNKEEFLAYSTLYSNALKVLNYFNSKGLNKGSKLIFQLSDNKNFVTSFWASLCGGIVSVPVSIGNNDEHRLKLINIFKLLEDAYLIVDANILDKLEAFAKKNGLEEIFLKIKDRTINIEDIDLESLEEATMVESNEHDLALIQFSSGSTGEPKGVMLTHQNIIENARGFLETAEITKDDSYLSWFPLTHDMGLMGWHINPLILGVTQVLIETNVFIRRPLLWMDSATKFNSTVLCSPNFGYRYLLKFLKKEQNWNLENIRLIFNGAEPISASLCDEFLDTLKPYGLKDNTMYTVYGLAEATLAVAFPKPSEKFRRYHLDINYLSIGAKVKDIKVDIGSVTYVDVGYPLTNMQIRITNNSNVLDENIIGHIEIKSISVTSGYYENKEATDKALKGDGWLDTGDLGFIRDGRLIITGRAKDIIIINGRNYYPHDIEDICCAVEGCELNKVVAVGSRNKSQEDEKLIIFVLYKKDLAKFVTIENEIKQTVLSKIGLEVSKVIPVKTIYKTTSGKLQRYKFLQKYIDNEFDTAIHELQNFTDNYFLSKATIVETLILEAENIVKTTVDIDSPLFEQGFSSISIVLFKERVSKKLEIEVDITVIFDYPTIQSLANYLSNTLGVVEEENENIETEIAIVSMACKFPDASNPEEFFDNLLNGVDSIKKSSKWEKEYYGGFLDEKIITQFDNNFFNISIAEANKLDPQVKILLNSTLELLDRGAIDYKKEKNIGVYIGVSSADNLRLELGNDLSPYTLTSNLMSTLSGRVAYYFDFKAPAISLDTACSSSLVAIHQAVSAIRNGDCKLAIAGGVNVILDALSFEGLNQLQALSPTQRCRTFDEKADGYIRGEGCGLVLLKPLKQALEDKDEILSIIKSSTLNHDGKSNGLTAPNGLSQQSLIKKAYKNIDKVDFIETHGTGTKLGDPIEINALSTVLKKQEILLGAVKTNIGHLESAAGVAGVIKTIMAIKEKKLPANLHLERKNPYINWDKIKLKPLTENVEWHTAHAKVTGVSSFGFSGTNAHIVLEEFIVEPSINKIEKQDKILLISTKEENKLSTLTELYTTSMTKDNLNDFIYSSSQKYQHENKIAIIGNNIDDFKSQKSIFYSSSDTAEFKTVFVFTGQGSHYPNMAKELFENEIIFKKYFLECNEVFGEYLDKSLVDIIFSDDEPLLNEPIYTQASLFTVEYALAKYLIDMNIKPDAVTGHSLGEYVAAAICGVLSLKDAIRLVLVRSKLISTVDVKGAMYLFLSSEDKIFIEINKYHDKLSIASVNAKNQTVVSGEEETLKRLAKELKEKGIKSIKLNINQAYHSILLDSILFDFYYEATKITYNSPKIPFISAMKAQKMDELDANYFTIHFRNSVIFADTIEYLNKENYNLFIEIGADAQLSSLIMQQAKGVTVLPTLRKNRKQSFYETLAKLYVKGFDINWNKFYLNFGNKMVIPTHPMNSDSFIVKYKQQKKVVSIKDSFTKKAKVQKSLVQLKEFVYQVSGIKEVDESLNLFELGLDSLSLFQLRESAKKEFGVEIEMKEFYLELNTLHKLSQFIDKNSTIKIETAVVFEGLVDENSESLSSKALIKEQLNSINQLTKVFDQQLLALKGVVVEEEIDPELLKNAQLKQIKKDKDVLSVKQQNFIDTFTGQYNQKTSNSKELAKESKESLTDWINTVIYRHSLKEINYPIVAKEAAGSKFSDIDDNSYMDLSMGYGSVFLGHNHPKVKEAMGAILESGFVLAPQTFLAKQVTDIIKEFTNVEKVTFSNTGTEAVMATLRMVRAKSNKRRIVKFQGSFHGTSDTILNSGDEENSYPTSLGVNPSFAKDMVEFQYGSPKVFEYLKENFNEIAGVLVEPIQSRRPDFQPKEFLQQLRKVTNELGIALIFDEMITGFRCARGGASEIFGVKPNIFTFGKVVGGTMPIGIIAGDKAYLDVIDGGDWSFGDESYPKVEMMTFGGTFCKHPLTLSASLATLNVLKDNPNIQEEVNTKTEYLAKELNQFFIQHHFPIKINHFGSLFKFDFYGEYATALNPIEIDMFFYLLLHKGVYTWEKRVCFLSSSHSQEDLDFIVDKVKETLYELKDTGFFEKIKTDKIEATSFQKRLYILSQFEKSSTIYNMSMAWSLDNLDIEKTQKVFERIVEIHPSLRTNLYLEGEDVYQKVNNNPSFTTDILEIDDTKEIQIKIENYINGKFDLENDLLFKVLIIKTLSNYILVIKTHHTIFDGPSIDIVMQDFYKLYTKQEITIPKKDYFNFTMEYKNLLQEERLQKQETFWLDKFTDIPVLNLPIDNPYPTNRTFNGDIEYFTIDKVLTTQLRKSARDYNVSINVLLYGCFTLFLNKITSQDDMTIGIPVTVRSGEYTDIVGMFANTVVLKETINTELNINDYLLEVQKSFLEILDNLDYSFERLIEKLNINKDLARNALFDVMFIYEDGSQRVLDKMGLEKYTLDKKSSAFDLMLEVIDEGESLSCSYEYYSDVFERSTIQRFISYFVTILEKIETNKKIKEIDIISKEEYTLLDTFNETKKTYAKERTIVELFEAQVEQHPDNNAVTFKDTRLTYKELNEKANQLAHYLIAKGIEVEDIVAIKIERSLEMLIGLLGILKSGAGYLPLDEAYPEERIAYILEDSQSKTMVKLETFNKTKNYSTLNPNRKIDARNLAYLIYTSGSTGKPKGVMLEHGNVVSFSLNLKNNFNFKERDVLYAITTISFDISVLELLSSLLCNLQIVISSNNLLEENLKEIESHKIDIIQTTPSRYKAFLDLNKDSLKDVKKLLIGGEKLSHNLLKELQTLNCELYNVYGPTEATVWSTFKRVDNAKLDIGRPLLNEQTYILDENLNQVPLGSIGELCIGGSGLARGYLNREELTSKMFIEHSILGRIYKTGDIAKYQLDGNIEYLGRIDDQVKIRGFRIELGEVENAIIKTTLVKEVVVVAKKMDESSDNQELVAYLIMNDGKTTFTEIKKELKEQLPLYMIPNYFIILDKFPQTPNGKIDKKQLPNPKEMLVDKETYIAPSNTLEKALLEIFQEVLKVERISIVDNFFEIGGHSLNAISLRAKINQLLNTNLKIQDIFTKGSIKELAQLIDSSDEEFIYKDFMIDNPQHDNLDSFQLTNVQQAYVLGREDSFEMGNTSTHGYSEFIFEFLDRERLEEKFNILLQRHGALRLSFINGEQKVNPYTPYQIKNHETITQNQLEEIRERLSHKVYDVTKAPLFDIEISQYKEQYILHISMDILLLDGISETIFIEEWTSLYNDEEYKLKELELGFQDYMLSYKRVRERALFEEAKEYWKDKIHDYNLEYQLPYKILPSKVKEPKFSRCTQKIDKDIWRELKEKAKKSEVGITSIILAIYGEVLCYFSNQENFTINLTLFNRLPLHEQINDILGDFTTIELFNYKKSKGAIKGTLQETHNELWEDLEHILYDGVDFQREIRREFNINSSKIIAPIVLTSILRGEEENFELNFDGYVEEGYAITQTPQVYIDNKAYEDNQGNFVAEWDYVEQIFEKETIEEMHNLYCRLIEKVATSKWNSQIEKFNLPQKDRELIEEVNNTKDIETLNSLSTLHELFEKQNRERPNNIAVIDKSGEYSYETINNYSNSIAVKLNQLNLEQQGIAIYSEKGYQQVVSALGVMKSSNFYLPLTKSPLSRIREILEEAKVTTLLVSLNYYEELKALEDEYTLLIIEETSELSSTSAQLEQLPKVEIEDIAYVIYTSGSTGKPKGVIATHKGAANTILDVNKKIHLDESDSAFAISELSFDLSVYDIFGLLSVGGRIVFPDSERREEPLYWCELINKYEITVWNSVPQLAVLLYEVLIDYSIPLDTLRVILLSGDYIPVTLPVTIKEENKNIRVLSLGGATEGTIWSIYYDIEASNPDWQTIPYGTPLANQGIYVLNKDLSPVPLGVIGDLYITGTSVSLGYYNNPSRTNEAFSEHPTLGYIYKTGDLALLNPLGYYEFKGRDDNQVKIRGFRVELGEIESALLGHDAIKECIVIAKKLEKSTSKELVTYLSLHNELSSDTFKEYLKTKLPLYMVPNYFMILDSIPLTSNGKVDIKALPAPKGEKSRYVVASSETEVALSPLFCEVLKIDKLSIESNFFEMGGNSLSAISLITKISKTLNTKIELKELFIHPTIKELSEVIKNKVKSSYSAIKVLPKQDYYDVSYAQRRLWLLDKIEDDFYAYNESFALEFPEDVDVNILKKSINILLQRHEILRTNFIEIDGEPKQVIHDEVLIERNIFDEVNIEDLNEYISKETRKIFNLQDDSLFYFQMINKRVLFLNIHHIIVDIWSLDMMVDELSLIYNAVLSNKPIDLPILKIHYKEFSKWQNSLLEEEDFVDENRNFWQKNLDEHKRLNFPTDFKRPVNQTFEGDTEYLLFSDEVTRKIMELSKNATLFITLTTMMNIFLSKYTNEDDILIGTPISNRTHPDFLNQIGFYLNTLPLRNIIKMDKNFGEILEEVKESTLEAFSHQLYPFDKLVEELDLARDLSQNPLFNIMLVLHGNTQKVLNFGNIKPELLDIDRNISKFDITFNFGEADNSQLYLNIEYNTKLYLQSTIERMVENFVAFIENIENHKPMKEISIVSKKEQILLNSFYNTAKPYPEDKTIIELFEEQVSKTPNNVAIVYEGNRLTYKELNQAANNIGVFLRENHKVKANDIVALLFDRGISMIVGILGVLKSGAGYLPVDPEYPKDRIDYILKDSKTEQLLTDSVNFDKALESSMELNIITSNIERIENLSEGNELINMSSPQDLLYVIYTSGSTGQPKGVMVNSQGIVSSISEQISFYEMSEISRVLQFTTYSFDVSVSEIFTTLLSGATLITASKEKIMDNLPRIVEEHNINVLNITPSLLHSIDEIKGLTTIITAGESAIVEDAKKYAKHTTYINGYGPTETFYVSLYKVDSRKEYSSIPIGKAMSNVHIYILDSNQNEVPIGAIGELCVGGVTLAKKYLNLPESSSEKFISHKKFGRIYKTGDMAKYLKDGSLEYLGRVDNQIKIRGFRVELEEIAKSIDSFPDIENSIVRLYEDELVAYIVIGKKEESNEIQKSLKEYLTQKLPSYMIPHYFMMLEELPLTLNGKVNDKLLPKPELNRLLETYLAPRNVLEVELCDIFEEVLKMKGIGITNSFFELGGDSIKAIKIISKINKLGYSVSVKDIFLFPTIKSLVSTINNSKLNLQNIKIPKQNDEIYYDLSYGQKGLFLASSINKEMTAYNIPIALSLEGSLDLLSLEKAFNSLLKKHEVLKTKFVLVEGSIKQTIGADSPITLAITHIQEDEIDTHIDIAVNHKFDLEKDNLIEVKLLKVSSHKHVLLIVIHHILVDGWSMGIISRDIQSLYNGYRDNKVIEVLPSTISYQDYIAYQEEVLKNIEPQKEYLLDKFSDFENKLELPMDFEKNDNRTFDGAFTSMHLGKERSTRLRKSAMYQNKTLFTLLIALTDVLLYLYSKEEDIVIGTPTNNIRQDERFSNHVGYFLNTLAIKSKVEREKTFLENFNTISMDVYNGFENSDYPFDKLIEDLKLSSETEKNPLFSVMVILQNFEENKLDFKDLNVKDLNFTGSGSKFDLQLEFIDEEDIFFIMEYSLDLFKEDTILKIRDNFIRLVDLVLDNIDTSIESLEKELGLDNSLDILMNVAEEIDEDF